MNTPMTPEKGPSARRPELTEERLNELKARIEADYYDSPEVLDSLADRLIHSGDLGPGDE